jgi:phosphoribosylformylglycinamidine (FGAM) synthase PurS component
MKATDQTLQETERALRKVTEKFPPAEEASLMTDIHLRVNQETGELLAYDDDDNEINRCVVEQWIDNKDDNFYEEVTTILRQLIEKHKEQVEQMAILKPFSFVLEDDDRETVAELYLVDDDTVIINDELMANLDQDLDEFLEQLLKE